MWKKLQGWCGRKLSKGGMSTFNLPSTLLDELHVMLNKFWWESGGCLKGGKMDVMGVRVCKK